MRSRRVVRIGNLVCLAGLAVAASAARGQPGPGPIIRVHEEADGTVLLLRDGVPLYSIIEGDILVPLGATAATFDTDLWDDGIVRYEFGDNVPVARRALMINAMITMEQISAIRFVQGKSTFDSGVTIESTAPDDCSGCDCANNATVGETFFGHMNICNWNSTGVLLHELGHVLNLWHEQSRSDRGGYVRINFENVPEDKHHNFEVEGGASVYGPYDFESLMHYSQCAFSGSLCSGCPNNASCQDGGRTVVVLPPHDVDWQNVIGTTNDLSYLDRLTISFLYPEPNWRFVDRAVCGFCDTAICWGIDFYCRSFGQFTTCPACDFGFGYENTPVGGTVWVQPGSYSAVGTYSKAVRVAAPLGGVVLGG